jgi:hypothetical protein
MTSLTALMGNVLSGTDLQQIPVRVRYDLATSVGPSGNRVIRFVLPKIADDCLDCRSIHLRFNLNITGTGADGVTAIDGRDVRLCMERVRVISGSTVVTDIEDAGVLMYLQSSVDQTASTSDYESHLIGQRYFNQLKTKPNGSEYIVKISPKGSLLNSECCLPLSRMSNLIVEITLAPPEKCLVTESASSDASYTLSNLELLCSYLRSPSISQYLNSNRLSFHVTDFTTRRSTIQNLDNLVRLPSAHTSLDSIVTVFRDETLLTGGLTQQLKQTRFTNPGLKSSQLLVNGSLFYDQDTNSDEQRYLHMRDVMPQLSNSINYQAATYNEGGGSFILGTKLSASPTAFRDVLVSGTSTKNLNSDIILRLGLRNTPANPIVCTTFMQSSCLVYSDGTANSDLRIRY